jgi:hypothetical protein
MQQSLPQQAYLQLPSNSNNGAYGQAVHALQQAHTLQAQMLASQRMQAQLQPVLCLLQNNVQVQALLQQMQAQLQALQQKLSVAVAAPAAGIGSFVAGAPSRTGIASATGAAATATTTPCSCPHGT